MTGTLKVTPERLISTAEEFGSQGNQLRTLTNEMISKANGLSSVWTGDAASAYRAQFSGLSDDMQLMYRMIQEHVTDLKQMANNYMTTETSNTEEIQGLPVDIIV